MFGDCCCRMSCLYKFDFSVPLAEQRPVLVQKLKCYVTLTKVNVEAALPAAVVQQQVTAEVASFIPLPPPNQSKVLQSR